MDRLNPWILFFIFLGLDIYAFQALRLWTDDFGLVPKYIIRTIYWIFSTVGLGVLLLTLRDGGFDYDSRRFLSIVLCLFFMALFFRLFCALILFIDDISRVIKFAINTISGSEDFNPSRSRFMNQLALIFGSIPILLFGGGVIFNEFRFKKHRHNLGIRNLPDSLENLKIVQLSDIHSGTFLRKGPLYKAIESINEEKPDIIVFTGDLVNNLTSEIDEFMDVFSGLKAKYGVFSILGNHDYGDYQEWDSPTEKQKNLDDMHRAHADLGWQLLDNKSQILKIGEDKLQLVGVGNISGKSQFHSYGDLDKAMTGVNKEEPIILLSHDPTHWDVSVSKDYPEIDITLSGHTHGMQFGIEIPGFIKWSPAQYIYPHWGGLYKNGHQTLYVNRGFGCLGYPGRVGILPEISVFHLTKENI